MHRFDNVLLYFNSTCFFVFMFSGKFASFSCLMGVVRGHCGKLVMCVGFVRVIILSLHIGELTLYDCLSPCSGYVCMMGKLL